MTEQIAKTIELPEPDGTFVVRAVTNRIVDEGKGPLVWAVGRSNPLASDMKIVRMYASDGELRAYSVSEKMILRHVVPFDQVRVVEEGLTLPVFLEAIEEEESEDDDDDDPEGEDLEDAIGAGESDTQPPPPPNGAVS